jgi:hypothetical protein
MLSRQFGFLAFRVFCPDCAIGPSGRACRRRLRLGQRRSRRPRARGCRSCGSRDDGGGSDGDDGGGADPPTSRLSHDAQGGAP